ncbi:MAG: hypothetical protein JWO83_2060 [Caulobacteraceae bacterium]|nr:hypothetical protein [Caulobacteraceae bacterium]
MPDEALLAEAAAPITGRLLTLPDGPIFHLHRSHDTDYELGEFRAWAGYRNLGADLATGDLAHLQHVLSFAGTEAAGRTGIHAHLAHVHIVIPTSGRGVFSYDGLVTEALPGMVIVQHGGTIHDQFEYSYAAASDADNRRTPQSLDPPPPGAPPTSFGFLELFVPKTFANVEIVPPGQVTETHQRTAWDHPYHAAGARFRLQTAEAPDAAYRLMATRPDLEVRDAETWEASGRMVATWIVRPAAGPGAAGAPVSLEIPGERDGIDILYMVRGSASFPRSDGEQVRLAAGDALTCAHGLIGQPFDASPDMRLIHFSIAAAAQALRERTADEIGRLENLGPHMIGRSEVRPDSDARPVNFLHDNRV